jgi:hypothetical protein
MRLQMLPPPWMKGVLAAGAATQTWCWSTLLWAHRRYVGSGAASATGFELAGCALCGSVERDASTHVDFPACSANTSGLMRLRVAGQADRGLTLVEAFVWTEPVAGRGGERMTTKPINGATRTGAPAHL